LAGVIVLSVALVSSLLTQDRAGASQTDREVAGVAQRYDVALHQHDWPGLERLAAKNLTFHNTDYGSTQKRGGFLAWARLIGDAYPDFFVSIDRISFDDDVVTMWFHEDGRFPATGVVTSGVVTSGVAASSGVVRLRIAHRSIVEMWSNYDEFGLLRQRPTEAVRRA
jgi:hypothetical protein